MDVKLTYPSKQKREFILKYLRPYLRAKKISYKVNDIPAEPPRFSTFFTTEPAKYIIEINNINTTKAAEDLKKLIKTADKAIDIKQKIKDTGYLYSLSAKQKKARIDLLERDLKNIDNEVNSTKMPSSKFKKATRKAAPKKAAPKKAAKRKPAKKAAPKNNCAVTLGRKGGKATKAAKKGIFSKAYKAKAKKKAAPKKKATKRKAKK